ncbi:MAG TPA: amino acid aminotransferase [Burkholderiaceae bacterium]|nr:amino acid aminotransferase [Burkholderiaceae bacterium]
MATSLFAGVPMAPRDPTLGPTEAFNRDTDPNKVNLGVGIYLTDDGRIPLLRAVAKAEERHTASAAPRGYLPIEGIAAYDVAVQKLLLGEESPLIAGGRAITAQSLGGTGALKIGADLLKKVLPHATVAISDPTWENHRGVFESAGFPVVTYPYYDAGTREVRFAAMVDFLKTQPPQTIIVLHACCHNPTGADLTAEQWHTLLEVLRQRDLLPFLDIAYQGFAHGLDEDGAVVRQFAQSGMPVLIASSFSKSFSLYGERVGALSIVDSSADESARVLSQLKRVIRANYSTPPTHGGAVVTTVLTTPELRASWVEELTEMRERIKQMRLALVDRLRANGATRDFSFVLQQNGMFSYSGLTTEQVDRLREEFHIYAVHTGRICVAALNSRNVDYVAKAITTVLQ